MTDAVSDATSGSGPAGRPRTSSRVGTRRRMGPEVLAAARDRVIPDVLAPGLRVLFCGINTGLWSAATGHHFARRGNRFWPTLHLCTSPGRVTTY